MAKVLRSPCLPCHSPMLRVDSCPGLSRSESVAQARRSACWGGRYGTHFEVSESTGTFSINRGQLNVTGPKEGAVNVGVTTDRSISGAHGRSS
jgi:hypothetical protein